MASSASELADLAQKHQDNKQKDNSARSREGVQQNTSTNNAETQDPPCQDPGDRTEEPSGIRHELAPATAFGRPQNRASLKSQNWSRVMGPPQLQLAGLQQL